MLDSPRSLPILRANRRLRSILHPLLDDLGLQPGQELVIQAIGTATGANSPTQSDLVDRLGVAQPTVARALKRLVSAGLAEFGSDRLDGRVVRVSLTASGRRLLPEIRGAWEDVDEELLGVLSTDEQHTLLSLLARIGESND